MADDNTEPDDAPPDPFEAELVAYLDGELDDDDARRVEARLANDPDARARAAALKRSFDLLDYLPKPEPSPNFTTRTLQRIPAAKPAASGSAPQPTASKSAPLPTPSTSAPVVLDGASDRRPLFRVAGLCAAVAAFAVLGYFVTSAVRLHLFPARDKDVEEARAEPDARVIENLPLYAAADDLGFVHELAKPDLFGDEPAVVYDTTLKVPPDDGDDRPTGKQFDALAKLFRTLPAGRQDEIVKLDRDLHALHAKEPKEHDRLFRALEVYAVWLDRLPEPERRGVLHAATPALRLRVIHDVRDQQWLAALPPPLKKKADALTNPKEKADLISQWKDEDAIRRDRWAFVRRYAETFGANKSPWPFDTDATRKEVIEFARATFHPDDPKRVRLTPDELAEYRRTFALAEQHGAWALYGLTVYELSKLHPHLPEPADPKAMWTDEKELPDAISKELKKAATFRLRAVAGKWPEFPLELHRELSTGKKVAAIPAVGPANVTEFKEPVKAFWAKELSPKLSSDERAALKRLEGKWPEYPREFVRLAGKYDLSVPGVTPPGSPKRWDATYDIRRNPRPN